MALPPWLAPQNFVDAMAKGAQAGLTRRGQNMAARQHAASLALQRDQLQVAQQQKAVEFAQSEARAAEALRQHNALESYRQQSLEEEQAARQAAAARAQANQQFQMQKEASREAHQALMEGATLRRLDAQDAAAAGRDKSQADLERHRLSMEDKAQQRLDAQDKAQAAKTNGLTPEQALNANMRARSMLELGPNEKPDDPAVKERHAAARAILEQYPIKNSAGETLRIRPEITQPPVKKGWFWDTTPPPVTNMVTEWLPANQQGTNAAAALTLPAGTNAPTPQASATNQPRIVDWIYDPKTGKMVKKK